MSQSLRQNNLFVGQDWTVIYSAMSAINFNAYDYDTIRQALIDYIRTNYPEDFNDWIESSEFVAIIEMLAYLAGNIAFRVDLNTRENFLDTATRRDSIFRLARMLSYNARRCIAGSGLMKLTQVSTDQIIYDSNGVNLQNIIINWNDANNPDWYEQFILVLNAALVPSNPFGKPVKSGTVNTLITERYDINNTANADISYQFTSLVNGQNMNFEFCNPDFKVAQSGSISVGTTGYFFEKTPSQFNRWSLIYRNDGNGNSSVNTGFFLMFKQGTLGYTDYILDNQVPNRVIDLNPTNINQTDVWAVSIDDTGLPLINWTKVPSLYNSNLVFNSVDRLTRNIFQAITRDQNGDDAVSLKFGDGAFGNIPVGRMRVYYRTSNNQTYTILPNDLSSIGMQLSYNSQSYSINNLNMTFSLGYAVSNAVAREGNASIQQNASAVYYTQNRMVNGEDYNIFPLQSTEALKVKAVNRTYSGQSRYIDINDPTGEYQNVKVFSNDGILFREESYTYLEVLNSQNLNTAQIVQNKLQPLLTGFDSTSNVDIKLRDFYLMTFEDNNPFPGFGLKWYQTGPVYNNSSVGQFAMGITSNNQLQGSIILPQYSYGMDTGSWVRFSSGEWANIANAGTTQLGTYGVILSKPIASGSAVNKIIPPLRVTFTDTEQAAITAAINLKQNFGLRYDLNTVTWIVISNLNLNVNAPFSRAKQGDTTQSNADASWFVQFIYNASMGWNVTVRGLQYVFESVRDTTFYAANTGKVINNQTLTSAQDSIKILTYNLDSQGKQLTSDLLWGIVGQQVSSDGYVDPRQVRLTLWDGNNDNIADNPDSWLKLVPMSSLVFWKRQQLEGNVIWNPTQDVTTVYATLSQVPLVTNTQFWYQGRVVYVRTPGVFLVYTAVPVPSLLDASDQYEARSGRNQLGFCWQHYAGSDSRVDPAIMNIVDIYVLTTNYDNDMRNWISRGRPTDPEPMPPTPEDLRTTFAEFDNYKMLTDQIVWQPVRYKLLFGTQADPEYQAVFKVVKLANSNITDSEIKSRVIQSIDNYFSLINWDFGQSFYFTELAAYIHQQNATLISSIVILPLNGTGQFGELFEIKSDSDQLFLSAARVTDVQIVPNLNPSELRLQ